MTGSLIYIASPYTTDDNELLEKRFEAVCASCAVLMNDDLHVFSPIAHGHSISKHGDIPTDWVYWKTICEMMIDRCQRFIVVTLDGWDKSVGVLAEIKYAESIGLTSEYVDPV